MNVLGFLGVPFMGDLRYLNILYVWPWPFWISFGGVVS